MSQLAGSRSWPRSAQFVFRRRAAGTFARRVHRARPTTYTSRPRGRMPTGGRTAQYTPTQMRYLFSADTQDMQCNQSTKPAIVSQFSARMTTCIWDWFCKNCEAEIIATIIMYTVKHKEVIRTTAYDKV